MKKLTSDLADCFIDHRGFLQIKIHCEMKSQLDLSLAIQETMYCKLQELTYFIVSINLILLDR